MTANDFLNFRLKAESLYRSTYGKLPPDLFDILDAWYKDAGRQDKAADWADRMIHCNKWWVQYYKQTK